MTCQKTSYSFLIFRITRSKIFETILTDTLNQISFNSGFTPKNIENVGIDSLWVSNNEETESDKLSVKLYNYGNSNQEIATSVYINNQLKGKSNPLIESNSFSIIDFEINKLDSARGKVLINDNYLNFDNVKFFNLPKKIKRNILVIENEASFLENIYNNNDFQYKSILIDEIETKSIFNQDLIILNELEKISFGIINNLKIFTQNGGNIAVICPTKMDDRSYKKLATDLGLGNFEENIQTKHYITAINYSNPFFKNVFKEKVTNFQYPFTNQFYKTQNIGSSILNFDNGDRFISNFKNGNGNIYLIASSLKKENSNFTSSPLVVPVFLNFSLKNKELEPIYYEIGREHKITINQKVNNQDVINLVNDDLNYNYIPLQIIKTNEVEIYTNESPSVAGNYKINNQDVDLKKIAFNYNSDESKLNYFPLDNLDISNSKVNLFKNVKEGMIEINEQNKSKNLWQLFIIFALVFLGIEMLILKFFKNPKV